MKKARVGFLTLGCKVNMYETNAMEVLFKRAGYQVVDFNELADVYVVNTCSVTNMADRKSRQMLHKAKKKNPDAVVIAVGCYVQSAKEQLEKDQAIDLVIGNSQKHLVVQLYEKYIGGEEDRAYIIDVAQDVTYEEMPIEDAGERTRAFIKIQDGCNQFCSYCIIPYARGRVRSRKEEDVIKEIQFLLAKGYKEFVLNGIHLSSYGMDEQNKDFVKLGGKPLLTLIEKINQMEGVERIRLGSLEPRIITDEFVSGLAKCKTVCPHFHLSLQSGCDETLLRMNRKYNTKDYLLGCQILRKYFENPAITTDVIVGFPGETQEEFLTTKDFLATVKFSQMHIFKYSVRKGTRAEKMTPQIGENIKTERSNQLLDTNKELMKIYQSNFLGQVEKVLFEEEIEVNGEKYFVGHNERYVKIAVPSKGNLSLLVNQIVDVTVEDFLINDILIGKIG